MNPGMKKRRQEGRKGERKEGRKDRRNIIDEQQPVNVRMKSDFMVGWGQAEEGMERYIDWRFGGIWRFSASEWTILVFLKYWKFNRGEISAFGMNKTCQVHLILMAELVLRDEWRKPKAGKTMQNLIEEFLRKLRVKFM